MPEWTSEYGETKTPKGVIGVKRQLSGEQVLICIDTGLILRRPAVAGRGVKHCEPVGACWNLLPRDLRQEDLGEQHYTTTHLRNHVYNSNTTPAPLSCALLYLTALMLYSFKQHCIRGGVISVSFPSSHTLVP